MNHGLIIGKFYPPHAGHHYLIDRALSECDELLVLVLANTHESITAQNRVAWLKERHPKAKVDWLVDDLTVDYASRDADRAHAKLIAEGIIDKGYQIPDILFSSETYGERLAADLDDYFDTAYRGMGDFAVCHRLVDLKRTAFPICATKVREDPIATWSYLSPPVKAGLTKRVVVCGAESTGTTTLTKALAERYQTVQVPEFGRTYSEALGNHYQWSSEDFATIMAEQNRSEEFFARRAGPVMFCDTDAIATCLFHHLYLQKPAPAEQQRVAESLAHKHCLYILTDDEGIPFDQDGYRLFPTQRKWATGWFERKLAELRIPHFKVTGTHEERMDRAVLLVNTLATHWDFTDPIEHNKPTV